MNYDNVICGLEIHSQLNYLETKLFCECSSSFSGKHYNENTCPICLGHPGSLPSVNGSAVSLGLKLAKSLQMKPNKSIGFTRKHYDYPDLPKGFQITQNIDGILGTDGFIPIGDKKYSIKQIQLEEDPAKLVYEKKQTIVDYNRSGITLIELVTDPIFNNPEEIKSFLTHYRRLLLYLEISDTKKEGAFRADVNVSVGKHPRVEIKNVGSDTEIINAFNYEVKRQKLISDLSNIVVETRHWDAESKESYKSREKEDLADYQYMNEGNIPKIEIPDDLYLHIEIKKLPWELESSLKEKFSITNDQLGILLDNPFLLSIYEKIVVIPENEVNNSLKERFFWQEYLSWYNTLNSPIEKDLQYNITKLDLNKIKILLTAVSKNDIDIKEFKRILRRHITKNESLEISASIHPNIDIAEISTYLKTNFSKIWEESKSKPKKINFLVGQGVKFSKGKVNVKLLRSEIISQINQSK